MAVWFVTGCSSGFGRALALRVLESGHQLVATSRDPAELGYLDGHEPSQHLRLALDVTDPARIVTAVKAAVDRFGRIDVLMNNAGYGLIGALEECSAEQTAKVLDTNLVGPLNLIKAVLPGMRQHRSGHIINLTAVAGVANHEGFAVYGAAKFGLEGASEALRIELAPLGIKITLVEPGPFRTDFIGRSLERGADSIADYDATSGKFRKLLESLNGKQPGDPARAAELIVRLAGEAKPPFRLPLGAFAFRRIRQKLNEQVAELDAWEPHGKDTDFPR